MTTTLMKRPAGEIDAPAVGGAEPQTLSSYIQSRFDECSRSQKDVAQYIIDHLDEAAFQTAEELARRANTSSSTVVRFSQALGFEGFPELQRAAREEYKRAHGAPAEASSPLFSIERTSSRRRSRRTTRTSRRARARPAVPRSNGRSRRSRRRPDRDRRHRPDGLLRQLPATSADAARPARGARRQSVAGGAQPARADRQRHAGDRALRRAPARAGRARDEARAPPQGADDGDHRRDALGGRQARPDKALLLIEQPGLCALAHGAAEHAPGDRLRGVLARPSRPAWPRCSRAA
jgi:hypothetical protein